MIGLELRAAETAMIGLALGLHYSTVPRPCTTTCRRHLSASQGRACAQRRARRHARALENSQPLTALLCRRKSAVTPYALVAHVMPRICGWPCARQAAA
jgi:hypothetical protein